MISLPSAVKIFLYTRPTDMRKGHDGLLALVRRVFSADAFSGHLFVFLSRRRNRAKILFWDKGGFVLYYKRLEKGRFRLPEAEVGRDSLEIASEDLAMLLSGIDLRKVKRQALWRPRSSNSMDG